MTHIAGGPALRARPAGARTCWIAVAALLLLPVLVAAPAAAQTYGPQPVGLTCAVSASVVNLRLACTVTGFGANVAVVVRIFSTPRELGTVRTDAAGNGSFDFTLPPDLEPGDHRVEAEGRLNDGRVVIASTMVTLGSPFSLTRTLELQAGGTGAETSRGGTAAADLPRTGEGTGSLAGIGSALVAAGGLLVLAARKRRSRSGRSAPAGS
ncbi:MAG TPA: LPXTG cell wall anchor domain-containing protein [Acidimicrobiales bacterium]|nr:LPXTG cell wall anchor domain-containing protein [Acidimicrobiales bacterium]